MTSGAGAPGMVEKFQRKKLENYVDGVGMGVPGLPPQAGWQNRYEILGLLNIISMNNGNLTLLALGCDLTQLGLDLNASGDIYDTFNSPWDRGLQRKNEEYRSVNRLSNSRSRSWCKEGGNISRQIMYG